MTSVSTQNGRFDPSVWKQYEHEREQFFTGYDNNERGSLADGSRYQSTNCLDFETRSRTDDSEAQKDLEFNPQRNLLYFRLGRENALRGENQHRSEVLNNFRV